MMSLQIDNSTKESIINSFVSIATELITNSVIVINNNKYSFIDIEFYYWHRNHMDDYTFRHNRPMGEFEAHRYGIDISLGNTEDCYGGILLRGLWDLQSKMVIPKSKLFSGFINSLSQGMNRFDIVASETLWKEIFSTTRSKLGTATNNNKKDFYKSKYRFLAKDKILFTKYPNKESIFRNSDLSSEEVKYLLTYSLRT